jgi:hypothetical protein
MKNTDDLQQETIVKQGVSPKLNIKKVGIISRDYRCRFPNGPKGLRDFSYTLPRTLKLLDDNGCDAVLFSLFSIIIRKSYDLLDTLTRLQLQRIKAIFLKEFEDRPERRLPKDQRESRRYVVFYRLKRKWLRYEFCQRFGSLTDISRNDIVKFVSDELPKKRILGNCCVVLCGESNGVKYSSINKKVSDTFGLRKAIPLETNIVLNPIHDRMTRFEMKLKRQFLSENGRWVISVWNKGKEDKNRRVKDGRGPAWTVFHNRVSKAIELLPNTLGIEIGILDVERA